MKRTPVKSGNVAEIGHDPDSGTLEVKFSNGGVYRYVGVDADKHAALMQAPSVGRFLNANIKGVHKHTKVAE